MKKILFLVVVTLFLAACGKKGPLVPPEALAPATITDLRAIQRNSMLNICWTAPSREQTGKPLKNLSAFRIYKREVLPPSEDCEECPTAYRLLRIVDLEYLQDVRRSGSLYCFDDTDLIEGKPISTRQFPYCVTA